MLYRVIDLPFSKARGRIDDEPLQRLLHGHEVVAVSEHLYFHDGVPHVVVSVGYRLASLPPAERPPGRDGAAGREGCAAGSSAPGDGRPPGGRWPSELDEGSAALFEKLRAWRTRRARDEAVPPYVVLTNAQLAQVAALRPGTLSRLGEIPGLGRSRVERFGREILEVVSSGVVDGAAGRPKAAGAADGSAQAAGKEGEEGLDGPAAGEAPASGPGDGAEPPWAPEGAATEELAPREAAP